MKLDIDMTREQLIEVISTVFTIERKYKMTYPDIHRAVLENLAYNLHINIKPTKEEWIKTEYFNQYFTEELKEKYLKSK